MLVASQPACKTPQRSPADAFLIGQMARKRLNDLAVQFNSEAWIFFSFVVGNRPLCSAQNNTQYIEQQAVGNEYRQELPICRQARSGKWARQAAKA